MADTNKKVKHKVNYKTCNLVKLIGIHWGIKYNIPKIISDFTNITKNSSVNV